MEKVSYTFFFLILLSGCAKISQESIPCNGILPVSPVIQDVVLPAGETTQIPVLTYQNATVRWTGPNNFSSTQNPLNLDFTGSTNYGLYTVTVYVNGCASIPDTFHVAATITVPCTVTNDHYLNISNATAETFSNITDFYNGYLGSSYSSLYSNNSDAGDQWLVYFDSYYEPNTNTIYALDSTGSYASGTCYAQMGISPNVSHSISGKVYVTSLNSYNNCIVFCNAKFKTAQGSYFTVTGAMPYFP